MFEIGAAQPRKAKLPHVNIHVPYVSQSPPSNVGYQEHESLKTRLGGSLDGLDEARMEEPTGAWVVQTTNYS